jgi:hypothetical protein
MKLANILEATIKGNWKMYHSGKMARFTIPLNYGDLESLVGKEDEQWDNAVDKSKTIEAIKKLAKMKFAGKEVEFRELGIAGNNLEMDFDIE